MRPKYKIQDVVSRSGVSAPTLRYYEEIGLLPEAPRTEGGYRLYDDATLERLAFIARAKQLGCSLEEVGDLLTAWDGGRCGPLERHRPEGACDDQCGYVNDVDLDAPIACTLAAGSLKGRLDEWSALLAHAEGRSAIEGGVRVTFAASTPLPELIRLVAAEQDCCQFFRFAITVDGRGLALEVRAPDDALPIVEALFGSAA